MNTTAATEPSGGACRNVPVITPSPAAPAVGRRKKERKGAVCIRLFLKTIRPYRTNSRKEKGGGQAKIETREGEKKGEKNGPITPTLSSREGKEKRRACARRPVSPEVFTRSTSTIRTIPRGLETKRKKGRVIDPII